MARENEHEKLRSEVQRRKELQLNYDSVEKTLNSCQAQLAKKQEQFAKREARNPGGRYQMSPFATILSFLFM